MPTLSEAKGRRLDGWVARHPGHQAPC